MDSKLILVEGLSGSGKSSTAQFISDQYRRNGQSCRWWHEEEKPHPLATQRGPSGAKSSARYRRDQLIRWRDFASRESGHTVVIESRFFQNAISQLLRVGVSRKRIVSHIRKVADFCKPMTPSLLYLHQPDYASALRRICDERGEEIESEYVRRNEASAYAKQKGLQGFDGLVQFGLDVRSIMEQLVDELALPGLNIDNSQQKWDQYEQQIGESLSLPTQRHQLSADDLGAYTGIYTYKANRALRRVAGQTRLEDQLRVRGQDFTRRVGGRMRQATRYYLDDVEFSIRLEGAELVMDDYGWLWPTNRLVPKKKDVFHIASWPFEMVFKKDPSGNVVSATRTNPTGRWLVTGQRYDRVNDVL